MKRQRKLLQWLNVRTLCIFTLVTLLSLLLSACGPARSTAKTASQQQGCSTASTAPQNQKLYVGYSTFSSSPSITAVTALQAKDGKSVWQTALAPQGGGDFQALQFTDGAVYVSYAIPTSNGSPGAVAALDAKDGHILWRYQPSAQTRILSMKLCQTTLYLYMYDTGKNSVSIEARSTKDARLLWRYTGDSPFGEPAVTPTTIALVSISLVDKDKCPRGGTSNACVLVYPTIHVLRSSDGHELWRSTIYTSSRRDLSIAATEQAVYVIYHPFIQESTVNEERAFKSSDGSLLWHTHLDQEIDVSKTIVLNNIFYVEGMGAVIAIDASKGKQLWIHGGGISPVLIADDGLIYTDKFLDNNRQAFCAVNASSGKEEWCVPHEGVGTITVANDSMIYSAHNFEGTVYALQKSNHKDAWHFTPAGDQRIFGLALEQ